MPRKPSAKANKKTPQFMVTWWCPRCRLDSGRTEIDGPMCYVCERKDGLLELKREKLTPQVMADRIKTVADRMMDNLRKAHGIAKKEWPDDPKEEIMLLEAMAAGQDFQTAVHQIADRMSDREKKATVKKKK